MKEPTGSATASGAGQPPAVPPVQGRSEAHKNTSPQEVIVASCAPATSPGTGTPEMDAKKITWCLDQAIATEKRHSLAARVEAWLVHRGSPAAGTGMAGVEAQERTGVSCLLMVAVFDKESTCGTNGGWSRTHHNGFGMHGPHAGIPAVDGMCWWPSWEEAVPGAFDFVAATWGPAQVADDLRGYCKGHPAQWVNDVEYVRRRL